MITIEQARDHHGEAVVYRAVHGGGDQFEQGVIAGVSDRYIFVRYGDQITPKATRSEDLEFLHRQLGASDGRL